MSKMRKALAFIAVSLAWPFTCIPAVSADIFGAGSTFAYPVLSKWADAYEKNSGITINYRSVGSMNGTWLAKNEVVDFGVSDAPLRTEELTTAGMAQFPIVVGGVVLVFNLKGVEPGQLKLTGPILANIFMSKVTRWNDKAIVDLNPGLSLPDQAIVPVHRTGDSGTRYIFADYLSKVSPDWKRDRDLNNSIISPNSVGNMGSQRVAAFILATAGAIGYVEFTYARQNKLAYALMKNRDGEFVAPNGGSFLSAAANSGWLSASDMNAPLTDQPGKESWPIDGSTYVLMNKNQRRTDAATDVLKFFEWAYHNGSKLADDLDYVPVPQNIVQLVESTWSDIKTLDGRPAWIGENANPRR